MAAASVDPKVGICNRHGQAVMEPADTGAKEEEQATATTDRSPRTCMLLHSEIMLCRKRCVPRDLLDRACDSDG